MPRLDTGPRYNVAARVSVWFPVWEGGPGTMFFVFMEGTPLFVLRWCVLGWFSVALFKILIAKRWSQRKISVLIRVDAFRPTENFPFRSERERKIYENAHASCKTGTEK